MMKKVVASSVRLSPAITQNSTRHCVKSSSCPPISGARMGVQAHDEHQHGQRARGILRGVVVADDRARDHHAGRAPAWPAGAGMVSVSMLPAVRAQRRDQVQDEPAHRGQLAAVAVGQRAVHDLRRSQTAQVARQVRSTSQRGTPMRLGDGREGGQVHMSMEKVRARSAAPMSSSQPGSFAGQCFSRGHGGVCGVRGSPARRGPSRIRREPDLKMYHAVAYIQI